MVLELLRASRRRSARGSATLIGSAFFRGSPIRREGQRTLAVRIPYSILFQRRSVQLREFLPAEPQPMIQLAVRLL